MTVRIRGEFALLDDGTYFQRLLCIIMFCLPLLFLPLPFPLPLPLQKKKTQLNISRPSTLSLSSLSPSLSLSISLPLPSLSLSDTQQHAVCTIKLKNKLINHRRRAAFSLFYYLSFLPAIFVYSDNYSVHNCLFVLIISLFSPPDADRVVEPRAGRLLYFTSGPENL